MMVKNKKKGQGLPINIIVMLIIGLVIFALGIALWSKFIKSGEQEIDELNSQIKTNINSLECSGEDWICAPSYKMKNGDSETFEVYIANKGDSAKEFSIDFGGNDNLITVDKSGCGSIDILYPTTLEISIQSGDSASIPFIAKSNKVIKSGCSFVTTVHLESAGVEIGKTPVIVRVD